MTPVTFEDLKWQALVNKRGSAAWRALAVRADGAAVHFDLKFWPGGAVDVEVLVYEGGRPKTKRRKCARPNDGMLHAGIEFDQHALVKTTAAE